MSNTSLFNQQVSSWANETKRKMKLRTLQLVLNVGPGHDQQKVTVRRYQGEASKIQFAFPYYMVFVHKGAGRGYGGNKTGLFTTKSGRKGITNKASMGRMGTGKRKPKPWFNPILEERFPHLAEIIAAYHTGKVTANIQKILIK
jgi:hypothetical protein